MCLTGQAKAPTVPPSSSYGTRTRTNRRNDMIQTFCKHCKKMYYITKNQSTCPWCERDRLEVKMFYVTVALFAVVAFLYLVLL